MPTYTAVDLGATSGRVVNVTFAGGTIGIDPVSRFGNVPTALPDGGLAWDVDALLGQVRDGLLAAAARTAVRSVAVDSWAVDYGLLDRQGRRVGPVHAYRSARTAGVMDRVTGQLGREHIYGITGIQFLPFNTIYQLVAARETDDSRRAAGVLMVPDLLNHALCGSTTNELTNASTTQLLDARTRTWSDELIAELGLRRDLLALHDPGVTLGAVTGVGPGIDGTTVIAAASHDTASAVAGTPLRGDQAGIYISCGTWSLVGCERSSPVTTKEALAANVTNELGVGGTTRLLKNVTGLWLLEECRRSWHAEGRPTDVVELVAAASAVPGGRSVVDPDDPSFAAPGAMPERIAAACRATDQPVPDSPAELTRVILDSLALAWRRTVSTIERIGGVDAAVIHLVGGGSANRLLAELCASACARPVLAGPTEATVLGNAVVQAIADGAVAGLAEGRAMIERALPPVTSAPVTLYDWDALEQRLPRR